MKSGQEIAKQNVARLQAWLEAHAGTVPYLSDGRVNRSRLAAEAGLDRQIFRNNPVCRAILEDLEGTPNRVQRPAAVSSDIERLLDERDTRRSWPNGRLSWTRFAGKISGYVPRQRSMST